MNLREQDFDTFNNTVAIHPEGIVFCQSNGDSRPNRVCVVRISDKNEDYMTYIIKHEERTESEVLASSLVSPDEIDIATILQTLLQYCKSAADLNHDDLAHIY